MKVIPVVFALAAAWPAAAQMQAGRNVIDGPRGSLEFRSPPFIRPLVLPSGAIGATVNLWINEPQNIDLDLDVYDRNPAADSSAVPVCSSYDEGSFETCRALLKRGRDTLWVRVFVSGGEKGSGFRLGYAPVYGNRLEGTSMTTAEARSLSLNETYVGAFRSSDQSSDPLRQLFRVDGAGRPLGDQLFVTLVPAARGDFVRLQVFDSAGALVSATKNASESQQLAVSGAARRAPLYVLAELASRRTRALQYVSGSGFRLRVSQQAQNIPVGLAAGAQAFRDDGSGERTYEVSVPAGSAASLVLEGSSYQLVLDDGNPSFVEADTAALGPRTSLRIGVPWNNSPILRSALDGNQTFRIRIAQRREAMTYGGGSWSVTMRATVSDSRGAPALLSFSSDSATVWDVGSSPTLTVTKTMAASRTGIAVALLPVPTTNDVRQVPNSMSRPSVAGGGSRMTARLSPRDAAEFDLVVCDDTGGILDIGESSVSWQWTSDRQAVFIVAIPDPTRFRGGAAPQLAGRSVLVGLYGGASFSK